MLLFILLCVMFHLIMLLFKWDVNIKDQKLSNKNYKEGRWDVILKKRIREKNKGKKKRLDRDRCRVFTIQKFGFFIELFSITIMLCVQNTLTTTIFMV